jgi:hypothetical protein
LIAGTLQQAYLEKNPLSALVAFAIAGGWDQTSFMRRHFCGRAVYTFEDPAVALLLAYMPEARDACGLSTFTLTMATGLGARAID